MTTERATYKDFTQRELVCSFLSEIGPNRFISTTTHYENDQQHVIVYYWKLPEYNPATAANVKAEPLRS